MDHLTSKEVAEQLRRALRDEVPVTLADPSHSWEQAYCGDVAFKVGDWLLVFFNDCNELDYTDSAESPDGREATYKQWATELEDPTGWLCPLCHLSSEEQSDLEALLEAAR